MFEAVAFYFFAALCAAMFLIVITTTNVLYALTALAAGMVFISAFFFMLGAEFLGVAQIIVYSGAIMAIYAFAMMFFDTRKPIRERHENRWVLWFLGGAILLILLLAAGLPFVFVLQDGSEVALEGVGNVQAIGYLLFTHYLIPFELVAVMLLVAMIAGLILGGKRMDRSLTLMSDEEANKVLKKNPTREPS